MDKSEKLASLADEISKYNSFSRDTVKDQYDGLAQKYDEVVTTVEYPDPKMCAELAESLEIPKSAEIFDMGCGTGLTGQSLADKGYTRIAGVDASPEMVEMARNKNVYYELEDLFLGQPESFPDKYKDRFDLITWTGVLLPGHVGAEIFDEMISSLKTGGLAIFSTRTDYIDENCQIRMDELTAAAKWELVRKNEFTRYPDSGEGIGRFKPTPCYMFVYKKL